MSVYTTWPGGVGAFVPFPPLTGAGKKKTRKNRKATRKNRKANRKSRRANRR